MTFREKSWESTRTDQSNVYFIMSLVQLNSYHKVANSSTSRLVSISLPFESVPLSLSSTQFEPTLYFFLVFEMKPQVYLDLITLIAKYKSDNLQYDMLGRWDDGTIVSSTKRLMFQVLFFIHNFLQNSLQKSFQFIFLFFIILQK